MTAASATADLNSARTHLRVAALDQWAALGVALAEKVLTEAGRDIVEAVRRVFQITQAIRLAIALARRLSDPFSPPFQPVPAKPRTAPTSESEALAENTQTENAPTEKPERRGRPELRDRDVSDDAILRRPLIDIVKVICRALGVVPDWSLWSDADETPGGSAPAPAPDRPGPVVARPSDPRHAIPQPRPRPGSILDHPAKPPPTDRLRTRLLSACAIGALIPTFPPRVL